MFIEMVWDAAIEEQNAVNAAEDKRCNQKMMAEFYADCIRADYVAFHGGLQGVNFTRVNAAIIKRWPKGLSRIKNRAWKLVEGK